jgi:hypothetical protein
MIASFLSEPIVFGTSVSEVLQDVGLATLVGTAFKHFNCHVNSPHFCWRFGHPVYDNSGGGTSFRACHLHHDERSDDGKVTAQHIKDAARSN